MVNVQFNLMPWRAQQVAYEAKWLKRLLSGALLLSCVLVSLSYSYIALREASLVTHIAALKGKVTATHPQSHHVLDVSFPPSPMLLHAISLLVHAPHLLCFNEVRYEKNKLTLQGYAFSASEVLDWMDHTSLQVDQLSTVKDMQGVSFTGHLSAAGAA
jgi:hypothetical protein